MLKVIDRFTTRDGIWDAEGRRYGITVEALVKYGHWDIPGKGGASHIFVHYKPGSQVHFRTEGNNSVTAYRTTDNSGWCNLPLFESSAFWGENNGPWIVEINGIEVARGLGLPEGYHVSTFLIVGDVEEGSQYPSQLPTIPDLPYGNYVQMIIRTVRNGKIVNEETVWDSVYGTTK